MTYMVICEKGTTSWGAYVPDLPGVSDTYFSVSNSDLGSSDCRTMLSSVPRRTGS